MDPPLINDATFSAANPSAYTLSEIWPFSTTDADHPATGGLGLRMSNLGHNGNFPPFPTPDSSLRDASAEESTVTDQSAAAVATPNHRKRKDVEDESSKMVPTSTANDLV